MPFYHKFIKNQQIKCKKLSLLTAAVLSALALTPSFASELVNGDGYLSNSTAGDYVITNDDAEFIRIWLTNSTSDTSITTDGDIIGTGLDKNQDSNPYFIYSSGSDVTLKAGGDITLTQTNPGESTTTTNVRQALYVNNGGSITIDAAGDTTIYTTNSVNSTGAVANGSVVVANGTLSVHGRNNELTFARLDIGLNGVMDVTAENSNSLTLSSTGYDRSHVFAGSMGVAGGGTLNITAKTGSNTLNGFFSCVNYWESSGSCSITAAQDNNVQGDLDETWLLVGSTDNLTVTAQNGSNNINMFINRLVYDDERYDVAGSATFTARQYNNIGIILSEMASPRPAEKPVVTFTAGVENVIGSDDSAAMVMAFVTPAEYHFNAPKNTFYSGNGIAIIGSPEGSGVNMNATETSNDITGKVAGIIVTPPNISLANTWVNHDGDGYEEETMAFFHSPITTGNEDVDWKYEYSPYEYMLDGTDFVMNAAESNTIAARGDISSVGVGILGRSTLTMNADEFNTITSTGSGVELHAVAGFEKHRHDSWGDWTDPGHVDLASVSMNSEQGVNSIEAKTTGVKVEAERTFMVESDDYDGLTMYVYDDDGYGVQAEDHTAEARLEMTTDSGSNIITSDGDGLVLKASKTAYSFGTRQLITDDPDEVSNMTIYSGYTGEVIDINRGSEAKVSAVIAANSGSNRITASQTAISAEGYGTNGDSAATVTISTVSGRNVITGETAIDAKTNSQIRIDGSSTISGDIQTSGETTSVEVNYGSASQIASDISAENGSLVEITPQDNGSLTLTGYTAMDDSGTINLNLSSNSLWYMTASSNVTSLSGSGSVVYENGGDALKIDTLTGSHTFALDLSTTGSESDMLYIVNGTSEKQTLAIKNGSELGSTMAIGDAVRFATIKNAGAGFGEGTELTYADGPVNYTFTVDYRSAESDPLNTEAYNDAYSGDGMRKPTAEAVEALYGGEGSSNVYVVKTAEKENAGGRTAAAAGKLVWRYTTDMDTYTRRMAQSTEFMPGSETGAWLRAAYHRQEADGAGTLHGPFWELGFSGDVSNTPERTHRIGFSAGYTVQSGSWAHDDGSLRVKDATAAFYYTILGTQDDTGASVSYWDNVLRYHHLRTHTGTFDAPSRLNFDGNRTQEAVSLSTEYGQRIPLTETVTLTPQAQFQLTYIGGFNSDDNQGMHTAADHDWSAVARIGADLSRRWGEGGKSSAYLKASLLHEFSDGQEIRVSGHSAASRFEHPGSARGSWAALGLGLNRRLGNKAYVYFDGETEIGSGRQNSYVFTGGFKYAF